MVHFLAEIHRRGLLCCAIMLVRQDLVQTVDVLTNELTDLRAGHAGVVRPDPGGQLGSKSLFLANSKAPK